MKQIKKKIAFTVLFLIINFDAFAAINIMFRNREVYPGQREEPVIEAEFRATQNGTPLVLNNDNAILIQGCSENDVVNNTLITFDVPQADGYQLARWTSAIATPHTAYFKLVVTNNNEVGTRSIPPLFGFGYELLFLDANNTTTIT